MKNLTNILHNIAIQHTFGNANVEIKNICFDSRKVQNGDCFVAVRGTQSDGHKFIPTAISQGAVAIVAEEKITVPENVVLIVVENSAETLALMASNYFDNPSEKLELVGITGTNGKTTCVTLLHKLFLELGYHTGLISTIENKINDEIIPSTHTTPDTLSLNELLAKMVKSGCTHCFMEVSSHAVVQHRITGLKFKGAVFTNISHDHLDYHGTFDEYIKAKKKFFDDLPSSAFALTNIDDKRGNVMLQNTSAKKFSYALKTPSDFKAKVLTNSFEGLELDINGKNAWFKLVGEFNAYNILAIYGVAVSLGEDVDEVLMQMSSLQSANGRFDIIQNNGITAIVDYAHTPDALQNVLSTINNIRTMNEQLITVVGCGGNRDKTKRPEMARIACEMSSKVIITSDNPREEEPQAIIDDMKAGISASNYKKTLTIVDRKEAIRTAIAFAKSGDIILVAGKGHENYQEIKGVKHHFDDKEIIRESFLTIISNN